MSASDVAKQMDKRDAGYKAEITKLKSHIVGLLDEKEQTEGKLKKTQELLVTSEAEASGTKTELLALKEQATKWEVDIAQLNADIASKSSNPLTFNLSDIFSTYPAQLLCRHILMSLTTLFFCRHLPWIF
jgi:chromosome segregation ATPase